MKAIVFLCSYESTWKLEKEKQDFSQYKRENR